jgi:hypothetical protein
MVNGRADSPVIPGALRHRVRVRPGFDEVLTHRPLFLSPSVRGLPSEAHCLV